MLIFVVIVHENNCPRSIWISSRQDPELHCCVNAAIIALNDRVIERPSSNEARELADHVVIVGLFKIRGLWTMMEGEQNSQPSKGE